jgi:hypothetical protein
MNIEVAHIPGEEGSNEQDNAIPLCFNCHGEIGRYASSHPKGLHYAKEELKERREQVYEMYTRHLVPPVIPTVHQGPNRKVPLSERVHFLLSNSGGFPPAKARMRITVFLGKRRLGGVSGDVHGYYSGQAILHLNPSTKINGNFGLPPVCATSKQTLRIQVDITVIDIYDREHTLLPSCFTYVRDDNYWFLEPTSIKTLVGTSAFA